MKIIKALLIISIQIFGILAIFLINWQDLPVSLILFNLAYFFYGQFSFSMGWHRYFSHKSFTTSRFLEWIFYLGGSSLFIGSMFEWLAEHKQHHSNLNSEKDPTNRKRGWLYSHLGWIVLFSIEQEKINKIIKEDQVYKIMYKFHYIFYFLFSLIIPVVVSYCIYPDFKQSFLIAFSLRLMLLHHTLGLLNSYCHRTVEPHTFNSLLASVLCVGEGYQLNHHLNPQDYRYGVSLSDWDPTKWLIWTCYKLRLVKNLKTNSSKEGSKC